MRMLTRGRLTKGIIIMNRSKSLTTYREVMRKARCVATFGPVRSLTEGTTGCTIRVNDKGKITRLRSIARAMGSKACRVPSYVLRPATIAGRGVSGIVVRKNFRHESRICLGTSCDWVGCSRVVQLLLRVWRWVDV